MTGPFDYRWASILVSKRASRQVPPHLRHWQEDIEAEAVAITWNLWERGVRVGYGGMKFVLWKAIRRFTRNALELPGCLSEPADEPSVSLDDRAWCMHTINERWGLLTDRQQDVVMRAITGQSLENHHKQWLLALTKLRTGKVATGRGNTAGGATQHYAEMQRLWSDGEHPRDIAARFGVSVSTARRAIREVKGSGRGHSEATKTRALGMYDNGTRMVDICGQTGASETMVREWARRAGMPARTGRRRKG